MDHKLPEVSAELDPVSHGQIHFQEIQHQAVLMVVALDYQPHTLLQMAKQEVVVAVMKMVVAAVMKMVAQVSRDLS